MKPCDSIFVPIGDGICIALFGTSVNYESHICIAVDMLSKIATHNLSAETTRRFGIRIGLNQNDDNLVSDINNRTNVVGAGVNFAARVMGFADVNQILVGQNVYESLNYREKYMGKFRQYNARAKHNVLLNLYQYVDDTIPELNKDVPSTFAKEKKEPRLSKSGAYYFAHCMNNSNFIKLHRDQVQSNYALKLLLVYSAIDSESKSEATLAMPYESKLVSIGGETFIKQYETFMRLPFWICSDLAESKFDAILPYDFWKYFEDEFVGLKLNESGKQKLINEWPQIWNEFHLDNYDKS